MQKREPQNQRSFTLPTTGKRMPAPNKRKTSPKLTLSKVKGIYLYMTFGPFKDVVANNIRTHLYY